MIIRLKVRVNSISKVEKSSLPFLFPLISNFIEQFVFVLITTFSLLASERSSIPVFYNS